MKRIVGGLFVCALAGCANVYNPRDDAAVWSGVSRTSFAETTNCVIRQLDDAMRSTNPLANSITHAAQIKEIDRVSEVAPQQTITVGAEVYFARVTREARGSKVELYTRVSWADKMVDALKHCA